MATGKLVILWPAITTLYKCLALGAIKPTNISLLERFLPGLAFLGGMLFIHADNNVPKGSSLEGM
ncbi:hypothetical protein BCR41DRAFT_364052 [Lobosporangium transversale]|uniref:Uncharacterized protein n=1 Tax=Lobosporangium transversale TaxID=64571 RepID=A0A1Y2G6V0_9FUNG|nr:hypothetical protein BCR41DRAFT_364052 [Lobosporangium transversale]ORY99537.1 hypothetical protein BCR41DRAFT_364052 [Lobosporangium transversale]|eukprot:XP_021875863.1 hypothetical protein BCR41DRAFT_364052 [Lobosporangium transversale]